MSVFNNPSIQSTINQLNGELFRNLIGFGIYSSPNNVYFYVMDYLANKTYILNDEWKLISFKSFTKPAYMINIGNSLYMTGEYNVWKVDQDLKILINYNPGGYPLYRGISHNPSNGFIYVTAYFYLNEIQVFSLDLTLNRRFSSLPHEPWSITFSSNQLYVGTRGGMILVYQNEKLINQYKGCDGTNALLTSILFDPNGNMATSCDNPTKKLYLLSQNGSLTGKSITTPIYPRYIGFDSKGRFILISKNQINIYN